MTFWSAPGSEQYVTDYGPKDNDTNVRVLGLFKKKNRITPELTQVTFLYKAHVNCTVSDTY